VIETGRIVLVIGGSGAIGWAITKTLLSMGNRVVVLDITPPKEHLSNESFMFIECDITNHINVQESLSTVSRQWGDPEVVVNSAAVVCYNEDTDMICEREEMEVNYHGAINVIVSVLPQMLSRDKGYIHNLGSMLSSSGQKGLEGYLASKAALAAYIRSLAVRLRGTGVVVNIFYPPLTRTPLTKDSGMPDGKMADPSVVGRKLARKAGSSRPEVYPDFMTRLQSIFLRSFPRLAAFLIDRMS